MRTVYLSVLILALVVLTNDKAGAQQRGFTNPGYPSNIARTTVYYPSTPAPAVNYYPATRAPATIHTSSGEMVRIEYRLRQLELEIARSNLSIGTGYSSTSNSFPYRGGSFPVGGGYGTVGLGYYHPQWGYVYGNNPAGQINPYFYHDVTVGRPEMRLPGQPRTGFTFETLPGYHSGR